MLSAREPESLEKRSDPGSARGDSSASRSCAHQVMDRRRRRRKRDRSGPVAKYGKVFSDWPEEPEARHSFSE